MQLNEDSVIPLKIWQTWHDKNISDSMQKNINNIKVENPEFEHNLFDIDQCEAFIRDNFPTEVYTSYNDLIPFAYKADLWKLCCLYIHGGIYIDVKMQFVDGFKLISLIDKEYYVFDGTFTENNILFNSIYNGFMVCKKNSSFLLNAINQLVENVKNRRYCATQWAVSGPQMLGKLFNENDYSFMLKHYGPIEREVITLNEKIIIVMCQNYRLEQKISIIPHYYDLWKNKKIYKTSRMNIFLPYYGKFPNYFQLYLDSLNANNDILTVFLITDIDSSEYILPKNLIVVPMSIDVLRRKISDMLLNVFRKTVKYDKLVSTNYKLVDFKISYPLLFNDLIIEHKISKYDYVGWGDCDVIYGKLSNFINLSDNYHIIGGWHGHFTVLKNTDECVNLFKSVPNIYQLFIDQKVFITDEIAYREPLINFIKTNNLNMFFMNKYFTDIVPPCFYYLFRKNYEEHKLNFFDVYHPEKNINFLFYDKKTSQLFTHYDDGEIIETTYVHLQKRHMSLPFTAYESGYHINENDFSLNNTTLEISNTQKTHDVQEIQEIQDIQEIQETQDINIQEIQDTYNTSSQNECKFFDNESFNNNGQIEEFDQDDKNIKDKELSLQRIRLHIPAVPHTITRDEYSHCAFTGKVQRFGPMMRSQGFEVYHYGVETSCSNATKDIILLSKKEWDELSIKSVIFLNPGMTRMDAIEYLKDPTKISNALANWNTPLYIEFNKRFREKLLENYRSMQTDIVCVPLGRSYNAALNGLKLTAVETGIGYADSFLKFRIFESYAWMHHTIGTEKVKPHNYWFVIPHSHNIDEFPFSDNTHKLQTKKKIGFFGRLIHDKGCSIIVEIAHRFPEVEFIFCGQGDPSPFMGLPNVTYKMPIHGKERGKYLSSLTALLSPTLYLEPFGAVNTEAQLCGTPVITHDNGGMVETVENFKTGLRCHTLADFCYGVQMALDNKFDRSYIRERANRLYNMYNCAEQYTYVFKCVLDLSNENNGWYSPYSYIEHINNNNIDDECEKCRVENQ